MTRRAIVPEGMQPPTNPYSHAVSNGQLVFTAGQVAPQADGIAAQTREVLEKLGRVLRAGGADFGDVLRTGVYLKNASDFAQMNVVYREYFPKDPPARSTIICDLTSPDILVEIDCVAAIPRAEAKARP